MNGTIVLLLIGLLIVRELLVAYWDPSSKKPDWLRWFNLILIGLFVAFMVAVASQVMDVFL